MPVSMNQSHCQYYDNVAPSGDRDKLIITKDVLKIFFTEVRRFWDSRPLSHNEPALVD